MAEWDLNKDVSDLMNEFASFRNKTWLERQLTLRQSNSVTKGEVTLANNYATRMDARKDVMATTVKGLRAELDMFQAKLDTDVSMQRLVAKAQQGLLSSEEPVTLQLPSASPSQPLSIGSPISTYLTEDQIEHEVKEGIKTSLESGGYESGIGLVLRRLEAKGYSTNVIHEIQGMVAMFCRKNGM